MGLLSRQISQESEKQNAQYKSAVAANARYQEEANNIRMQQQKRNSNSWASMETSENSGNIENLEVNKRARTDLAGDGSHIKTAQNQAEPSQQERLGPGDHFIDDDQIRIQETVEKLQRNQQIKARNKQKALEAQQAKQIEYDKSVLPENRQETVDQQFHREYGTLVKNLNNIKQISDFPKISCHIPVLDLRVKILFDEDLKTMIFPKIQEFEMRVSSSSPLELAAKILAIQNGHKAYWQNYEFAYYREMKNLNEVKIQDLKKTFGQFKDDNREKIVLFYKVREIEQILKNQAN